MFLETFKTFKANPIPMPFAELYGALESKAVDGQENPYSVILSSKFYEVNKYVSGTNHVYATNPVQISKRFWDKLSPAEQKLLQDAAIEAQNYQRVVSREAAGKAVAELKAKGMLYNDIAPAEMARMRAEVKPVHDKFAASYEPAVVRCSRASWNASPSSNSRATNEVLDLHGLNPEPVRPARAGGYGMHLRRRRSTPSCKALAAEVGAGARRTWKRTTRPRRSDKSDQRDRSWCRACSPTLWADGVRRATARRDQSDAPSGCRGAHEQHRRARAVALATIISPAVKVRMRASAGAPTPPACVLRWPA